MIVKVRFVVILVFDMNHRRREVEIMRDVLEVCLRGASKTKIVYKANLNFTRLNKYLGMLLSLGFVAEDDDPAGSVVYKTTEAGVSFLKGCFRMQGRFKGVRFKGRGKV